MKISLVLPVLREVIAGRAELEQRAVSPGIYDIYITPLGDSRFALLSLNEDHDDLRVINGKSEYILSLDEMARYISIWLAGKDRSDQP